MTESLVIFGAGGFGREALDVADAINGETGKPIWEILGVVDDAPSDLNITRLEARGIRYLGRLAAVPGHARMVLAVGSPIARQNILRQLQVHPPRYATLVHPGAVIGSQVRIGDGSVICAGVSVGTNVTIGNHAHLNPHAVIGHDTTLGDNVSVNPNATVSGACRIGSGVLIGASGVILNGLTVGDGAIVGGGACVVRDVPAGVTVKGVPAK